MRKSKFTESQIVGILKEGNAGIAIKDLVRSHGISVATYYKWKSRYGGMDVAELARMRELEAENSRLKRLYAEQALEILPSGIYRHYKGRLYEVIGLARHSESGEALVVYRALYGDYGLWVRPAAMFLQDVTDADGNVQPRFALQKPFS